MRIQFEINHFPKAKYFTYKRSQKQRRICYLPIAFYNFSYQLSLPSTTDHDYIMRSLSPIVLRYFCEKCKQIVCRECTVVLHKTHKYRYMEQSITVKEIVETLKALTTKVQSKEAKAAKGIEDVNATTDLITASITGLKNSVHNTATEMIRHIRLAEEEMINEIDRIQSKKFHCLKRQIHQLQDNLETFEYGKTYAEHALKYLSEVRLLSKLPPLPDIMFTFTNTSLKLKTFIGVLIGQLYTKY